MRITGGIFKNHKIQTKTSAKFNYRPTSEKTRLAIFNILDNSPKLPFNTITGCVVADIFCGSGSFGLEALSRGAEKVIFVDQSPEQLALAKQNLASLKQADNGIMLRFDVTNLPEAKIKCNVIYIDPPYHEDILEQSLKRLVKYNWIAPENIIILESSAENKFILPKEFKLLDERSYGKVKLSFVSFSH